MREVIFAVFQALEAKAPSLVRGSLRLPLELPGTELSLRPFSALGLKSSIHYTILQF